MIRFTKMHGTGNDYVYIDLFDWDKLPGDAQRREMAKAMSPRRFGAGGDGVIFIEPASDGISDVQMRIFNLDGSEGEMCGNGARCVALYMFERRMFQGEELQMQTKAGRKNIRRTKEGLFSVDMGRPVFEAEQIPVRAQDPSKLQIKANEGLYSLYALSMGNPHAVTLCDDLEALKIEEIGPLLENSEVFPNRANIEFIRVQDGQIHMRVWERGSGETLACGTGACASAVAAMCMGLVERGPVTVHLLGGDLKIDWDEQSGHVFMQGPATFVYDGMWLGGEPNV